MPPHSQGQSPGPLPPNQGLCPPLFPGGGEDTKTGSVLQKIIIENQPLKQAGFPKARLLLLRMPGEAFLS